MLYVERNLRDALKKWFPDQIFWVEPGVGSSVGMTDAILEIDSILFPVELKAGKIRLFQDKTYRWNPVLRPAQWAVGDRLFRRGINAVYIVIEKTSGLFYGCHYSDLHPEKSMAVRMAWLIDRSFTESFIREGRKLIVNS